MHSFEAYRLGTWLDHRGWGIVQESSFSRKWQNRIPSLSHRGKKICNETHQKDHLGQQEETRLLGNCELGVSRRMGASLGIRTLNNQPFDCYPFLPGGHRTTRSQGTGYHWFHENSIPSANSSWPSMKLLLKKETSGSHSLAPAPSPLQSCLYSSAL